MEATWEARETCQDTDTRVRETCQDTSHTCVQIYVWEVREETCGRECMGMRMMWQAVCGYASACDIPHTLLISLIIGIKTAYLSRGIRMRAN